MKKQKKVKAKVSRSLFNANGTSLHTTSILHDKGHIDLTKLQKIGLLYLTSSTVWGYFTQNLAIGALINHGLIFYSKNMVIAWKQTQP